MREKKKICNRKNGDDKLSNDIREIFVVVVVS